MPQPAFGDLLRNLREARALTGVELSRSSEVSLWTISRIENDRNSPMRSTAMKLLRGLEHAQPLTRRERAAWFTALEQDDPSRGASHAPTPDAIADSRDERRLAHRWLDELIDVAGEEKVLGVLLSLGIICDADLDPTVDSEAGNELRVWHPPEPFGTGERQRISTYKRDAGGQRQVDTGADEARGTA